jgi:hypothetical protein
MKHSSRHVFLMCAVVLLLVNLVAMGAGRAGAQVATSGGAAHGKCVGIASDGVRVYRAFEDGYVDVIWPKAEEATPKRHKGDGKWHDVQSLR